MNLLFLWVSRIWSSRRLFALPWAVPSIIIQLPKCQWLKRLSSFRWHLKGLPEGLITAPVSVPGPSFASMLPLQRIQTLISGEGSLINEGLSGMPNIGGILLLYLIHWRAYIVKLQKWWMLKLFQSKIKPN